MCTNEQLSEEERDRKKAVFDELLVIISAAQEELGFVPPHLRKEMSELVDYWNH